RTAAIALALIAATGCQASAAPLGGLLAKKDPKVAPKAATFVAFAVCQELEADNPALTSSQRQNLLDIARMNYQNAIEADANHLPAYTGLARVYTNMNHHDKAMETYHRGLQKFPKNASLWFDVGLCYCRTRAWEPGIGSFQKALEVEPENRTTIQALGFCEAR